MISFTCLPFVFHLSPACLPLWVWLVVSPTCLPLWVRLSFTLGLVGRVSHLSPTLGLVGRMISFTFPICLASLGRMILPLSTGLHPTLGALGRMSLHLCVPLVFHTCLPLWVPWAA